MSDFDKVIFKEKTFSDIIEEIYNSKQNRSKKIELLIENLERLITNITDATIITPVLKECIETEIDNDELLIKMAAIVQRSISNSKIIGTPDESGGLALSEKEMLELEEVRNKMLAASFPKQIEENHSDIIDKLSDSLHLTERTEDIIEISQELDDQNLFDQLSKEIDMLMNNNLDATNNKFKISE